MCFQKTLIRAPDHRNFTVQLAPTCPSRTSKRFRTIFKYGDLMYSAKFDDSVHLGTTIVNVRRHYANSLLVVQFFQASGGQGQGVGVNIARNRDYTMRSDYLVQKPVLIQHLSPLSLWSNAKRWTQENKYRDLITLLNDYYEKKCEIPLTKYRF